VIFSGSSLSERAQLFRELATLVNAGMSLGQALSTLGDRRASPEHMLAVRDCARQVMDGQRFSEAMRRHPQLFPEMNQALVAAGEEGGQLDDMLLASAEYLEREHAFQQVVTRETFYPKIMLGAVIIIPLVTRVLIAGITTSANKAALVLLHSLAWYLLAVALPIAVVVYLYRNYQQTAKGRRVIDEVKLRLPLIGPIVLRMAWAKVCRSLAALYSAGVGITKAMRLAGRTAGNQVIQESLERAIPLFEQGKSISESLATTGYVPDLAMSMLRTGEATGDIDVLMTKVGEYFEAEAETGLKRLTVAIVPISIVIFGIVVLIQMAQAYGGYFSSVGAAGQ
jgi:type IV pilus assembly protein PilC